MASPAGTHVSGLIVAVRRSQAALVSRRVAEVPGLVVHVRDEAGARLVVTVETDTLDAQRAARAALLALPGVLAVDLVCHYVDPGGE